VAEEAESWSALVGGEEMAAQLEALAEGAAQVLGRAPRPGPNIGIQHSRSGVPGCVVISLRSEVRTFENMAQNRRT
jgi:hypothetical protein